MISRNFGVQNKIQRKITRQITITRKDNTNFFYSWKEVLMKDKRAKEREHNN